ncbi:MFS transporter [Streptomyces caniscabiei]|uniref:MFS transporter n=1 Tax=Streptomyces caniscabiei TaxID=2746961 RepID=A0ABU4MV87_9ACTN|nr:MFS transporter [Streptomyces caniscabiei]MBE4733485.1 MHS family MFS transporter [Streptomyces caniscabiei]MBE4754663.1 MHS family MFS transporter [Streptomyces caniscabiei]MBE4768516.1 MHS family MFS transporter [Streptomyces caniscabiei]MBE4781980.1 MHS family MFS transporter [Streptomyces caniscabiei]MBE4793270.1 MHS family MFS transporter [Streptomyces caniscabiei]
MSQPSTAPGPQHRTVALAAMAGTTIEWYDFFIYALCTGLVFNQLFFQGFGEDSLIISFATIGISFFFRPVGAALAGHLGDRLGRRAMLIATLVLMGAATTLIGLVPTRDSIGLAAPVILVFLRILQGLSAGGEWGGAALIAVEHAPTGKRGRFGAFPQLGAPLGLLLANGMLALITALTTDEQLLAWGWRIPFLLSGGLVAAGFIIRRKVDESPVYRELKESGNHSRTPLAALFRHHWPLVIGGALLFAANNAVGYMTTGGYVQAYSVNHLEIDPTTILICVMIAAVTWLSSTMAGGILSDRIGRIRVYQIGFAVQLAWMFPFFALLNTADAGLVVLGLIVYSIGLGLTYGPQAALFSEMYPTAVRYSGAALSYAIGAVLGGAFAPMIAEALQTGTGTVYSVGVYLTGVTVVGLVVTFFVKERKDVPLGDTEPDQHDVQATVSA